MKKKKKPKKKSQVHLRPKKKKIDSLHQNENGVNLRTTLQI